MLVNKFFSLLLISAGRNGLSLGLSYMRKPHDSFYVIFLKSCLYYKKLDTLLIAHKLKQNNVLTIIEKIKKN